MTGVFLIAVDCAVKLSKAQAITIQIMDLENVSLQRKEQTMLEKPRNCVPVGTYEHCVPMCVNRSKVVYVDYCVARLVAALEAAGFRPVASCCGHGKMPPSVMLEDRTNVVMLTEDEAEDAMRRYRRNETAPGKEADHEQK